MEDLLAQARADRDEIRIKYNAVSERVSEATLFKPGLSKLHFMGRIKSYFGLRLVTRLSGSLIWPNFYRKPHESRILFFDLHQNFHLSFDLHQNFHQKRRLIPVKTFFWSSPKFSRINSIATRSNSKCSATCSSKSLGTPGWNTYCFGCHVAGTADRDFDFFLKTKKRQKLDMKIIWMPLTR